MKTPTKITIIRGTKGTGMGLFSTVMTYRMLQYFKKRKKILTRQSHE